MTERIETYDIASPATIALHLHAGDIRFKKGSSGKVVLKFDGSAKGLDDLQVDTTSDSVTVRTNSERKRRWVSGSINVIATIPENSNIIVKLGSGDVYASLPVVNAEIHVGSGDIRTEDIKGDAEVKVGSGDIRLGNVAGVARISSAAGDVRVDDTTEVTVTTAAGDLFLGSVSEVGRIKSATGDIRVGKHSGTDLSIKTMSGDVHVGLVQGLTVNASVKTLSGDFRNRIRPSSAERIGTTKLTITSFSGDVTLSTAR